MTSSVDSSITWPVFLKISIFNEPWQQFRFVSKLIDGVNAIGLNHKYVHPLWQVHVILWQILAILHLQLRFGYIIYPDGLHDIDKVFRIIIGITGSHERFILKVY